MECLQQQVICLHFSDNCTRGKKQQMQEHGRLSIAYACHMVLMGDNNIVHVHSHWTECKPCYKSPNKKLACHSQAHDYSYKKRQDSCLGSQGDSSSTCSH